MIRTRCLSGNTLENVVYKRVQDGHSLIRDTRVRMNLLEDWKSRSKVNVTSG